MGLFDFLQSKETRCLKTVTKMVTEFIGLAIDGAGLDQAHMPLNPNSSRIVGYVAGLYKSFYELLADEPAGPNVMLAGDDVIRKLFPTRAKEMLQLLATDPALDSVLDGFLDAADDCRQFSARLPMLGIHHILLDDFRDYLSAPDMPDAMIKIAALKK